MTVTTLRSPVSTNELQMVFHHNMDVDASEGGVTARSDRCFKSWLTSRSNSPTGRRVCTPRAELLVLNNHDQPRAPSPASVTTP